MSYRFRFTPKKSSKPRLDRRAMKNGGGLMQLCVENHGDPYRTLSCISYKAEYSPASGRITVEAETLWPRHDALAFIRSAMENLNYI